MVDSQPSVQATGRHGGPADVPCDFEQRERHWQETTAALRRALLRVSLAAQGLDPQLDQQLRSLRDSVRDGADPAALNQHLDDIAQTLLRLEQQPRPAPRNHDAVLAEWLTRLSQIATGSDKARLDKLLDQLRHAPPSAAQWQEATRLLEQVLASAGSRRESGWLRRIMGTGAPRPERSSTDAQEVSLPSRARTTLLDLLRRLRVPSELETQARQLQTQLQEPLPLTELPTVLEDVAALVVAGTQTESEQLEQFLKQLTDRLDGIQGFLQAAESGRAQSVASNAELDQDIRAQVDGIHSSLRNASDLERLKSAISRQLDGVISRMTAFQEAQQRLSMEAEQRARELAEKLAQTEREADRLRASLMAQQLKAQIDPLTEVANREAYAQRLSYEYARWRRSRHPLSLTVADIDRFKAINDRFGHSTGDKVLRSVARILQANMRQTDFLVRYGGEEFVVLMPDTNLQQATLAANKLRAAIEARPFHAGGERIPVTMSFGVAEFTLGDSGDDAFNRADKALYQAKAAGRNTVVAAEAERAPDPMPSK